MKAYRISELDECLRSMMTGSVRYVLKLTSSITSCQSNRSESAEVEGSVPNAGRVGGRSSDTSRVVGSHPLRLMFDVQ